MKLIQIRFSHNCIKIRKALDLKGLDYEIHECPPMDRDPVVKASGQPLMPALVDGDRTIADSSAILRYLEERYPQPSLLPDNPAHHSECWLIEDWACARLMEMTRRIAYWQVLQTPGKLEELFFPTVTGLKKKMMLAGARKVLTKRFRLSESRNRKDVGEAPRAAQLILDRIGAAPYLFGKKPTVADVSVASLAAPLRAGSPDLLDQAPVAQLVGWARNLLGEETLDLYKP